MKKVLIIIGILALPFVAFAVTGENSRFDWTLGKPSVVDDSTSACNDTAVARFDWVLGQPSVVHDSTANCTAAVAPTTPLAGSQLLINQGRTIINQGQVIIQ